MSGMKKWYITLFLLASIMLLVVFYYQRAQLLETSNAAPRFTGLLQDLPPNPPPQPSSNKLSLTLKIEREGDAEPGVSTYALDLGEGTPIWGITDSNGISVLEIQVVTFPITLTAFAGQRKPESVRWLWESRTVLNATDTTLDWRLKYSRHSVLRGIVVDESGAGLRGYPLAIWPSYAKGGAGAVYPIFNRLCHIGLAPLKLQTDTSGQFTIEGIHPDVALSFRGDSKESALRVEFTDLLPIRTKYGVDGISEYTIKLTDQRLPQLAITIQDCNGLPVKGALVKTRIARVDAPTTLLDTWGPSSRTNLEGTVCHALPVLNAESPASLEGRNLWVVAWHEQYGLTYHSGRVSLRDLKVRMRFPSIKESNALSLTFIDMETKRPVKGVPVSIQLGLFGSTALATLKSDESGLMKVDGFHIPPPEWWNLVGEKLRVDLRVLAPFRVDGRLDGKISATPGDSVTVEVVRILNR